MTEKLKQVIKREIAKLPKENQKVINAFNWINITEETGKKYLLNESEINDLQVQTLLVLIGLTDPENYMQAVENYVGTSKKEAEKITEEVMQKIFIPINDILIENIKQSMKNKNTNWQQNLDFILSGGDYSSFITPVRIIEPEKDEKKKVPVISQTPTPTIRKVPIISIPPLSATPTLADIKANTEKTDIPIKPKTIQATGL